jgi:hypothetical protein
VSEVVLAIIIVRDVLAGILSIDLPFWQHLGSSLGIRSDESSAWLGAESQGMEHGNDEVLDIGVLFAPHVEGSFLEKRFLLGVVQSPHQSVVPELGVLLTVVEDGEELVTESEFVFRQKGLKSTHGGITNGAVLVFVFDNVEQNVGGSGKVDVLEGDDGLSLLVEFGGCVDPVREDLNVLVQKSGLCATVPFAGAAEKGGEREFNNAVTVLGGALGEEGLKFFKKVFSWVADVVS